MSGTASVSAQLFGGVTVTLHADGKSVSISDSTSSSKKTWALLGYLLANRRRCPGRDELSLVLWPDDEAASMNSLKALVFRTRETLDRLGAGWGARLIVYKSGGYMWNDSVPTTVDAEEFTRLVEMTEHEPDAKKALWLRQQTAELYRGDFMDNSRAELWAHKLALGYRQSYLDCCRQAAAPLLEQKRWAEAVELLKPASDLEPYDEELQRLLITALDGGGDREAALRRYKAFTELLMGKLGAQPSQSLLDMYRRLVRTSHDTEPDIDLISDLMTEGEGDDGAFYAEFEIFREIYRHTARSAARTGECVQLAMLTIESTRGTAPRNPHLETAMARLGRTVAASLRLGDAYTRYSANQFLVMLPSASYEDGLRAMERVALTYKRDRPGYSLVVRYSLRTIRPKARD